MAEKLTSREGSTRYNQGITESSSGGDAGEGKVTRTTTNLDVTTQDSTSTLDATNTTSGSQTTTTVRDLSASSTVEKQSVEMANIGFSITFKVPLLGRFPVTANTYC